MHTVHPSGLVQVQQLIPVKQTGLLAMSHSDRSSIPRSYFEYFCSAVTMKLPITTDERRKRQFDSRTSLAFRFEDGSTCT
jgi:hypothetical protein